MALPDLRLRAALLGNQRQALDLGSANIALDYSRTTEITNGTGAGKADLIFHDQRTIAPSSNDDLDLVGGLTDPFGATISMLRVKGLIISAATANANNVLVGAAAGTVWATLLNSTGVVTLRPGAFLCVGTGQADAVCYTAVGGASDLLRIANSGAGTSVTYDIMIFGTSA